MRRTILLSLLVAGTALALVVGSVSALAGGGPVGAATAVLGVTDEGEDGDTQDVQTLNGDDTTGAEHVADVIAEEFEVDTQEVLDFHDEGIGFGALFKLYQLSRATGMSVEDLIAAAEADGGFAFGKQFNELTEEQKAVLDEGPKNLGALVSASHKPMDDAADAEPEDDGTETEGASTGLEQAHGKFAAKSSNGHGPPAGVPAHGRN